MAGHPASENAMRSPRAAPWACPATPSAPLRAVALHVRACVTSLTHDPILTSRWPRDPGYRLALNRPTTGCGGCPEGLPRQLTGNARADEQVRGGGAVAAKGVPAAHGGRVACRGRV